jgi:sn-glycerol 3-phosphate transport system substrate-binding protein
MLKIKSLSVTALSTVLMLTACGSPTSTPTATPAPTPAPGANTGSGSASIPAAPTEKVKIKYWYAGSGKLEEAKKNLVKQFNESQTKIEVAAEMQGASYDDLHAKVQAAFAAGNAPAVSDIEIVSTGIFARSGMLLDLTPLAERDKEKFNLKDFIPGLMGNSYVDKKLYGLPFMRSTPLLYKNVTMLKEAGLDPAGPNTWSELEKYARVLKEKGKTAMTLPMDNWYYEALVAQSGGQVISDDGKKALFNSPEGVAPLEFWKRLATDGLIKIPVGDTANATVDKDWSTQISAFKFVSTAGLSSSIEIAKSNNFEMQTAFMPSNKVSAVPTGGIQLVITSKVNDKDKEAAWEFLKFMTSNDSTIYQHKFLGYLPVRTSALESPGLQAFYKDNPQYKIASDQLKFAKPRPMESAYPEIMKIIKDALNKSILDAKVTPQDALNEAAEKANKLLSK